MRVHTSTTSDVRMRCISLVLPLFAHRLAACGVVVVAMLASFHTLQLRAETKRWRAVLIQWGPLLLPTVLCLFLSASCFSCVTRFCHSYSHHFRRCCWCVPL